MEYELAKKLKDAGWRGLVTVCNKKNHICFAEKPDCELQMLGTPTLEKLIEACGEDFFGLNRLDNCIWSCHFAEDENASGEPTYNTPEEAVANLWLALNKK